MFKNSKNQILNNYRTEEKTAAGEHAWW